MRQESKSKSKRERIYSKEVNYKKLETWVKGIWKFFVVFCNLSVTANSSLYRKKQKNNPTEKMGKEQDFSEKQKMITNKRSQ